MSSPGEGDDDAVVVEGEVVEVEPDEIVIRVADNRAIVIGPEEQRGGRWGRSLADLLHGELRSLLQKLDPATKAWVESQRLTGRLVELHETDRGMMKSFKAIAESDGWLQANFRDRGRVTRIMRIRPASGVAVVAGGAAIVGAIAAQAQAAEMARDIKAIRQGVDAVAKHLRDAQVGDVRSVVDQIGELVTVLREHGRDGVEAGTIPILQNEMRRATERCTAHLKTAVRTLESVNRKSPRQAEKSLSEKAAWDVMLYMELLGQLHAASVQLGLAEVALNYHEGKVDVARTKAEVVTRNVTALRGEIEEARSRIDGLDASIRGLFQSERGKWAEAAAVAGPGAFLAAQKVAGSKTIKVRGVQVPVAPLAAAVGLIPAVAGKANSVLQAGAEKKLDRRLAPLTQTTDRSTSAVEVSTERLEMLQALTAEVTDGTESPESSGDIAADDPQVDEASSSSGS